MAKEAIHIVLPDRDFLIDLWEISAIDVIVTENNCRYFDILLKTTRTSSSGNIMRVYIANYQDPTRSLLEQYRTDIVLKWASKVTQIKHFKR